MDKHRHVGFFRRRAEREFERMDNNFSDRQRSGAWLTLSERKEGWSKKLNENEKSLPRSGIRNMK
jgi:hypothetical protein